jgi:hypothetical protein
LRSEDAVPDFAALNPGYAEIDTGIRSLDAGQGRESSIDDFIRQKHR